MLTRVFQQLLHGYCFGNALWYGSRGLCRVWDPVMVVGCTCLINSSSNLNSFADAFLGFRPPVESHLKPTGKQLSIPSSSKRNRY
jgi:hypothetical protein